MYATDEAGTLLAVPTLRGVVNRLKSDTKLGGGIGANRTLNMIRDLETLLPKRRKAKKKVVKVKAAKKKAAVKAKSKVKKKK
jgi:hypothetical protein